MSKQAHKCRSSVEAVLHSAVLSLGAWMITLSVSVSLPSMAQDTGSHTEYLQAAAAGVKTLQAWYVPETGLYRTTGWWNAANATTVIVDYSRLSGSKEFLPVLSRTLHRAQGRFGGFLNTYYDDEGWWALAWIDAYDLTADTRYLNMASSIFADMTTGWDDTCGGGIWWSKDRTYKNAIANELFLSVAAHLAMRSAEPTQRSSYGGWAKREWRWFKASGMINVQQLVNDGLERSTCKNNGKTTWTYNQGVLIGGLVELNRTEGDAELVDVAKDVASAALGHLTDTNGILHDVCEPRCGADGVQFKGIFVRNLLLLQIAFPSERYLSFFEVNAHSIVTNSRGPRSQYGQVWSGPFDTGDAASQTSALDALLAAGRVVDVSGSQRH